MTVQRPDRYARALSELRDLEIKESSLLDQLPTVEEDRFLSQFSLWLRHRQRKRDALRLLQRLYALPIQCVPAQARFAFGLNCQC